MSTADLAQAQARTQRVEAGGVDRDVVRLAKAAAAAIAVGALGFAVWQVGPS